MPRGGYRPGAGRKRGSGKRAQTVPFRQRVRDYCEKKGVDPHCFLADVLAMPKASLSHKLIAARELAQYIEPKLKAVEHTGEVAILQKLQALDTCTDAELETLLAWAEDVLNGRA